MRGAVSAFQRWQFSRRASKSVGTRLKRLARLRLAAGIGPNKLSQSRFEAQDRAEDLVSIVVVDYQGERYWSP